MGKETFVTGAEIVETFLPVGRPEKPVLGTPAVTHCKDFTVPAKKGQPVQFGLSEGPLKRALKQLSQ